MRKSQLFSRYALRPSAIIISVGSPVISLNTTHSSPLSESLVTSVLKASSSDTIRPVTISGFLPIAARYLIEFSVAPFPVMIFFGVINSLLILFAPSLAVCLQYRIEHNRCALGAMFNTRKFRFAVRKTVF